MVRSSCYAFNIRWRKFIVELFTLIWETSMSAFLKSCDEVNLNLCILFNTNKSCENHDFAEVYLNI